MLKKGLGFLSSFVFCIFIGCTSQPLTQNVITDIGGVENIGRFQYYTSADTILTATEKISEPNIDRKGTASVTETIYRDVVIISKNTMGVLMDSRTDENGLLILEICFEEKATDSDKRITFKQDAPGLERSFYIVYTDPRKRLLMYGDREYSLETRTGERVFLRIKIDKTKLETERVRRVKGRKVEN
jgi:hypothetical protein